MRNLALSCFLLIAWSAAIGDTQDWIEDWQYFDQWAAMPAEGGTRAISYTSEQGVMASIDFLADNTDCGAVLALHISDGRVSDIGRLAEFDLRIEYRVDRNEIWYIEQPTLITQESLDGTRAVNMLVTLIDWELLSEIREGQFLRVKVVDANAFRVDLSGSMAAIDTAYAMCLDMLKNRQSDDDYFRPDDNDYFQNSDDVFF